MYSVVHVRNKLRHPDNGYQILYFLQTDLPTKEDGDKWITENISEDIDNHWVMQTSAILFLHPWQRFNLDVSDDINVETDRWPKDE